MTFELSYPSSAMLNTYHMGGSDNIIADALLCDSIKEVLETLSRQSVIGIVEACTELTLYACFGASFVFL